MTNFCTSAARANIFRMTKDFKKLSGLREEFALPYGVETGSLNVSSCIFLRITLGTYLLT